jgi:hypothetical protein
MLHIMRIYKNGEVCGSVPVQHKIDESCGITMLQDFMNINELYFQLSVSFEGILHCPCCVCAYVD